uniref:Filaggrin-2-like isoform X2 n=1 Tax=Crassostrea virginica TaxID=6565 RepID=A0A8B8EGA0_CRAVI|nr:filaggrin-2-like isoform X2 [Crassostrea virginica]
MSPVTLYIPIFVACFALNHGTPLNGGTDSLNLNFGDFPAPAPNAPDLQKAGLYQSSNTLGSEGTLSGALGNQNMIMEPSSGMDFGQSFGTSQSTGLGRQTGLGMRTGFNQNPSSMGLGVNTGFGDLGSVDSRQTGFGMSSRFDQNPSSMGLGVNTGFGDLGSVDGGMGSMGIGPMDVNSGFGNPSGSFGEIPEGVTDQGLDLSNTVGQTGRRGMSSNRFQTQRNVYMTGAPVVPGARGVTRNVSRRPMPVLRPPPVILLPPPQRRLFSLFGRRNPGVMPMSLIPLGPPMPIPYTPRQL